MDNYCFPAERARASVYDPVAPLYARFYPGIEFGFHENFEPGTHNYDLHNRQALYRFLNRQGYSRDRSRDEEILSQDEILDYEAVAGTMSAHTQDAQEGTRAFMEKRKPSFKGQ